MRDRCIDREGFQNSRFALQTAISRRANLVLTPEGRHYSCRASSGYSVVLVDEAAEPVAAPDFADR
jgi:hypothetical protein